MTQREANKRAARIVEHLIMRWFDLHDGDGEDLSPMDQARLNDAMRRIQYQMEDRAGDLSKTKDAPTQVG